MNAAIAAELSGYAKAARMSQAALAEAMDMNEAVVQRYLAGTRNITVERIIQFAYVLKFEPAELWERAAKRLG